MKGSRGFITQGPCDKGVRPGIYRMALCGGNLRKQVPEHPGLKSNLCHVQNCPIGIRCLLLAMMTGILSRNRANHNHDAELVQSGPALTS